MESSLNDTIGNITINPQSKVQQKLKEKSEAQKEKMSDTPGISLLGAKPLVKINKLGSNPNYGILKIRIKVVLHEALDSIIDYVSHMEYQGEEQVSTDVRHPKTLQDVITCEENLLGHAFSYTQSQNLLDTKPISQKNLDDILEYQQEEEESKDNSKDKQDKDKSSLVDTSTVPKGQPSEKEQIKEQYLPINEINRPFVNTAMQRLEWNVDRCNNLIEFKRKGSNLTYKVTGRVSELEFVKVAIQQAFNYRFSTSEKLKIAQVLGVEVKKFSDNSYSGNKNNNKSNQSNSRGKGQNKRGRKAWRGKASRSNSKSRSSR